MFESKEQKELIRIQKELAELMKDNLRSQFTVFYLTVLLDGKDEPVVITSKMLEHPFNSYVDTTYTCIWGKRLRRILGVSKTQDQAEAIKLNYEVSKHKDYYYVVYGEYPNIGIDKREYVAEDTFNYCLRSNVGNIDIVSKDNAFGTFEEAIAKQIEKIQNHKNSQLFTDKKGANISSVAGTTTFGYTVDENK